MKYLLLMLVTFMGCPEYEITVKPVKKPVTDKLVEEIARELKPGEKLYSVGDRILVQPYYYYPTPRITVTRHPEPLYRLRP